LNSGSSQFYSNLLIKDKFSSDPRFIYIGRINLKTNVVENAIILTLKQNMFNNRLNCREGVVADGYWHLSDCILYTQEGSAGYKSYVLQTSLKVQDILNYSQQIYNVPFWSMPQIISSSEKLGMQTLLLEIYYNKLLLRPIIIVLLGLMPFYFFKAEKSKIWSNTIDSLVVGVIAFLCINIATNFLTQYIKSAIICNSLPILFLAMLIAMRLKSSYKYPI
jgi:lipopolysaccharide export LptBFGC system permease protein LptF